MIRRRRWRLAEERQLFAMWEDRLTIERIAARLSRTVTAVYQRARRLGLQARGRSDFEPVGSAAKRCGLHRETLKRLLRSAGVFTYQSRTPTPARWRRRCVDPAAVDDVVAAWLEGETPAAAVRRLGLCVATIRRRLSKAGLDGRARKIQGKPVRVTEAQLRQLGFVFDAGAR